MGGYDKTNVYNRTQGIFQQIFEDPTLQINGNTTAEDIPAWDSLSHISLILALESEFGMEFSSSEVTSITCVDDLCTILGEKRL